MGEVSSIEQSGQPDTIIPGQLVVDANASEQVPMFRCSRVLIKTDENNTGNIYVGRYGVTTTNGFKLAAAQGIEVHIRDSSKVWLASDQDSQKVYYMIEVH
jgi:hypothetical protein